MKSSISNKRLFELKFMYFKLYNSSETFQRMMNNIFWELLYEIVLTNYIDSFTILA